MIQKKKNYISKCKSISLHFFLFLLNVTVNAQTELTGFVDVIHNYSLTNNIANGFQMNQFEIDITHSLNNKLSIGGAVAYNNETENMELSIANIHYNLWGSKDFHPRQAEKFNHIAINIGLNDVPFGLDYLLLASHDRTVISKPIIVEKTIDDWNDIGVNLHGIINIVSFDLNIINGFNNKINLSGKINVSTFRSLSFSISHASDFTSINNRKNWITGIDVTWQNKSISIKSEYLWATGLLDGEQYTLGTDIKSYGYYVQTIIKTKTYLRLPVFITLRLGNWSSNIDSNFDNILDSQNRFSLGIGYQIIKSFSLRSEFLIDKYEDYKTNKSISLQAVVNF